MKTKLIALALTIGASLFGAEPTARPLPPMSSADREIIVSTLNNASVNCWMYAYILPGETPENKARFEAYYIAYKIAAELVAEGPPASTTTPAPAPEVQPATKPVPTSTVVRRGIHSR